VNKVNFSFFALIPGLW